MTKVCLCLTVMLLGLVHQQAVTHAQVISSNAGREVKSNTPYLKPELKTQRALTASQSGRFAIIGLESGEYRIIQLRDNRVVQKIAGSGKRGRQWAAFDSTGEKILTFVFPDHTAVEQMMLTYDGKQAPASKVDVWSFETGEKIDEISLGHYVISALHLAGDQLIYSFFDSKEFKSGLALLNVPGKKTIKSISLNSETYFDLGNDFRALDDSNLFFASQSGFAILDVKQNRVVRRGDFKSLGTDYDPNKFNDYVLYNQNSNRTFRVLEPEFVKKRDEQQKEELFESQLNKFKASKESREFEIERVRQIQAVDRKRHAGELGDSEHEQLKTKLRSLVHAKEEKLRTEYVNSMRNKQESYSDKIVLTDGNLKWHVFSLDLSQSALRSIIPRSVWPQFRLHELNNPNKILLSSFKSNQVVVIDPFSNQLTRWKDARCDLVLSDNRFLGGAQVFEYRDGKIKRVQSDSKSGKRAPNSAVTENPNNSKLELVDTYQGLRATLQSNQLRLISSDSIAQLDLSRLKVRVPRHNGTLKNFAPKPAFAILDSGKVAIAMPVRGNDARHVCTFDWEVFVWDAQRDVIEALHTNTRLAGISVSVLRGDNSKQIYVATSSSSPMRLSLHLVNVETGAIEFTRVVEMPKTLSNSHMIEASLNALIDDIPMGSYPPRIVEYGWVPRADLFWSDSDQIVGSFGNFFKAFFRYEKATNQFKFMKDERLPLLRGFSPYSPVVAIDRRKQQFVSFQHVLDMGALEAEMRKQIQAMERMGMTEGHDLTTPPPGILVELYDNRFRKLRRISLSNIPLMGAGFPEHRVNEPELKAKTIWPILNSAEVDIDAKQVAISFDSVPPQTCYFDIQSGQRLRQNDFLARAAIARSEKSSRPNIASADETVNDPIGETTAVDAKSKTDQPVLFLTGVGVAEYENLAKLECSAQDIQSVKDLIISGRKGAFSMIIDSVLIDESAKSKQVIQSLDSIVATAQPEDTVILMYSGHGVIGKRGLYIMTHESDLNELVDTAVNWETVAKKISEIRAKRILLLLNVCHAGAFNRSNLAIQKKIRSQLETKPGFTLIASSEALEESVELEDLGLSAFGFSVCKAIEKHGIANSELLFNEISTVIGRYTDRQHPVMLISNPVEYDSKSTKSIANLDKKVASFSSREANEYLRPERTSRKKIYDPNENYFEKIPKRSLYLDDSGHLWGLKRMPDVKALRVKKNLVRLTGQETSIDIPRRKLTPSNSTASLSRDTPSPIWRDRLIESHLRDGKILIVQSLLANAGSVPVVTELKKKYRTNESLLVRFHSTSTYVFVEDYWGGVDIFDWSTGEHLFQILPENIEYYKKRGGRISQLPPWRIVRLFNDLAFENGLNRSKENKRMQSKAKLTLDGQSLLVSKPNKENIEIVLFSDSKAQTLARLKRQDCEKLGFTSDPKGERAAIAIGRGKTADLVKFFDLKTGNLISQTKLPSDLVEVLLMQSVFDIDCPRKVQMDFLANGESLLLGLKDRVLLLKTSTAEVIYERKHKKTMFDVQETKASIAPNREWFATHQQILEKTPIIVDARTGKVIQKLRADLTENGIEELLWSPNSRYVAGRMVSESPVWKVNTQGEKTPVPRNSTRNVTEAIAN